MKKIFKSTLLVALATVIGLGGFAISGTQTKAESLDIFGVASNSFGYYILVANPKTNTVQKFDLNGNFLNDFIKWFSPAELDGPDDPVGACPTWKYEGLIAVSICRITDMTAVTDYKLKKVFTINPNVTPHHPIGDPSKNELQLPWHASETEVAEDIGNYVIDMTGNKYVRYDPPAINFDKTAVECEVYAKPRYSVPPGYVNKPAPEGEAQGQFKKPEGIGVDRRGFILVADTGNNRIQKFRRDGSFFAEFRADFNKPVYVIPDFNDDSPNRYYIADQDNHRIAVFDEKNHKLVSEIKPVNPDGTPLFDKIVAVAIDMDYNIWVADVGTMCIYKLSSIDSKEPGKLQLKICNVLDTPPIYTHVTRVELKKYSARKNESTVRIRPYAQLVGGRTMVPLRWIAENALSNPTKKFGTIFKTDVAWDGATRCATFTMPEIKFSDKLVYPKKVVKVWIGKAEGEVNGKKVKIDAPPVIIDGSTFVPLRFIAEAFDAEVRWKEPKQQPITKNGEAMILLPSTEKVKAAYGR
jgi:DNA-binding beta-propeller fold protein YncE